ncbi:extracellular solute-binding protein [Kribbella sp. NPDC006257]|uniref:extracellular solute-binding protein n=1 Tax=Kribbella sp. NPDC006257 TaxID=3156738 RepID=UPI0033BD0CF0
MQSNRRQFLTLSGVSLLAATSGTVLAGCGGSGNPASTAKAAAKATPPDYVPYGLVEPDLPGTAKGVMPGFFKYPRKLVDAYKDKPGAGAGDVKILTNMFNPAPPGVGSNAYWKALNDRVGANLDITMTPAADYVSKLSTVVAGGDLPDIMMIASKFPNRGEMLSRLCADLTPHLSGAAIKDYQFLANLPTESWFQAMYKGGIHAIPIARSVIGTILFSRADLIKARSLNPEPAGYAEFVELAKALTDAKGNHWAFGASKGVTTFIGNMLGVPNVWKLDGGRFVSELEVPERKEAVARTAELYKAGVFHPDSLGGKLNLRDLFGNGTIALNADGYAAWDLMADTYGVDVGAMPVPGFDGGKPVQREGAAIFALTAFKKADDDRVKQLLRICDWLAAPLGTSEYMFRRFGVEGVHYTWKDDKPERTSVGKTQVSLPLEYVADAPHVLGPSNEQRVRVQRAYQEKIVPNLLANPGAALYSATSISKSDGLDKLINAAELDIISGRKPLSSWDDAVATWKKRGGDKIREEYANQ